MTEVQRYKSTETTETEWTANLLPAGGSLDRDRAGVPKIVKGVGHRGEETH